MKKKLTCCLIFILCLFLLCSCNNNQKATCLGNAVWGMTPDEVKASEDGKIVNGPSDNVLNWVQTDELKLFGERTVTVAYLFTDNKLSSITVLCFSKENEPLADAMASTRAAISAEYGEGTANENKTSWKNDISAVSLEPLEGSDSSYVVLMSPVDSSASADHDDHTGHDHE